MVSDVENVLKKARQRIEEGKIEEALHITKNCNWDPRIQKLIGENNTLKEKLYVGDARTEDTKQMGENNFNENYDDHTNDLVGDEATSKDNEYKTEVEDAYRSVDDFDTTVESQMSYDELYHNIADSTTATNANEQSDLDVKLEDTSDVNANDNLHDSKNENETDNEERDPAEEENRLIEINRHCLRIRATVLLAGIEVWTENSNLKPTISLPCIKSEIEYLIGEAERSFYDCRFEDSQLAMATAESWYTYVAPKRKPKPVDVVREKVRTKNDSFVSYKVVVRGDELDLEKRIELVEKRLKDNNLENAKKHLQKAKEILDYLTSYRMTSRVYALMQKLEAITLQVKAEEAKLATEEARGTVELAKEALPSDSADPSLQTPINIGETAKYWIEKADLTINQSFNLAHEFILKAETFDTNADQKSKLKDMMAGVQFMLNFKKETVELSNKNAGEETQKGNYNEAFKILTDAHKINPTAKLENKIATVTAAIEEKRKTVQYLLNLLDFAEGATRRGEYLEARKHLLNAYEFEPCQLIDDKVKFNQMMIQIQLDRAKELEIKADDAIRDKDFKNAEKYLVNMQNLKMNIDVKTKLAYVRREIASRSCSSGGDQTKDGENQETKSGKPTRYHEHSKNRAECLYSSKEPSELKANRQKALAIVKVAKISFLEGKFDFAENILKGAARLCMTQESEFMADLIKTSRTFLEHRELDLKQLLSPEKSEQTVDILLKKAIKQHKKGNIDKALEYYERAQNLYKNENMHASENIAIRINSVIQEMEEMSKGECPGPSSETREAEPSGDDTGEQSVSEDVETESYKIADDAEKALENKEYDKAQSLAQDAKNLLHSQYIDELLKRIESEMLRISPDVTDEESSHGNDDEQSNVDYVSQCIGLAEDMKKNKWYYAAKSWLKLANGIHLTPTGKEELEAVQEILKKQNRKPPKELETKKKEQAKHVLLKASYFLASAEYNKATTHLIIAQDIYNNLGHARDLMPKIFDQKFQYIYNEPTDKHKRKNKRKYEKSTGSKQYSQHMVDSYIEAAHIALKLNNANLVKEYLEKCSDHYASEQSRNLLMEVRYSGNQSSAWSRLKSFIENFKFW